MSRKRSRFEPIPTTVWDARLQNEMDMQEPSPNLDRYFRRVNRIARRPHADINEYYMAVIRELGFSSNADRETFAIRSGRQPFLVHNVWQWLRQRRRRIYELMRMIGMPIEIASRIVFAGRHRVDTAYRPGFMSFLQFRAQ